MNTRLIRSKVERLLQPDYNYLDIYSLSLIHRNILCRQRYSPAPEDCTEQIIAQEMFSFLPNKPLRELKRGAYQLDPNSILLLADCYKYGLKGLSVNIARARKLYKQPI
jgi:TPR repeat protein